MHCRRLRSIRIRVKWFKFSLSRSRTRSWYTSLQTITPQPLREDGFQAILAPLTKSITDNSDRTSLNFLLETAITWFQKNLCRISSSSDKEKVTVKHEYMILSADSALSQARQWPVQLISCTGWYHRPSNCTNYYLSLESGKRNQVQGSWGRTLQKELHQQKLRGT